MRKTFGLTILLFASTGFCADLLVPSQYPTIQQAINTAVNGDIVIISPGVYEGAGNTNLDITNKIITVRSNDPDDPEIVASTIIDCNGSGRGINLNAGAAIEGLTITRGNYTGGAGIYVYSSSVIRNCVITNNSSPSFGGGIYVYQGYAYIYNCVISKNLSQTDGGGVYIRNVSNTGLFAEGCTFAGNQATNQGGGVSTGGTSCVFSATHSIFWDNIDSGGAGSATSQIKAPAGWAGISFSCVEDTDPNDTTIPFGGAEKGNIDDDPLFVNPDVNDYHLTKNSPCIEAGNPLAVSNTNATDIDGQPRIMGLVEDMGADEYEMINVVTSPVQGEVWATGSERMIEWVGSVETVDIFLSVDNGQTWDIIAQDLTGDSFIWTLPDSIMSNQCLISVLPADGDTNAVCRESGLFTIWPYPDLPPVPPSLQGKLPGPDLSQNRGPQVGCVKWVFETSGPVSSQVAVTRPYWDSYGVYIGCEDGNIYALDDLGDLIWSYDINTPIVGSPAVGYYWMVYVAGQNGWLYAIDDYGQVRWTQKTDGPIYSTPVVGYDSKIYVCSQDGVLYALDEKGSQLWTFAANGPADLPAPILATPAIDKNGTVYAAGLYDPNLYALDSNTGSVKWVCNFSFGVDPCEPNTSQIYASPAIGPDGTIYQTLINDPNLYAIDPCDGNILWSIYLRQGSDTNASGWSSLAVGPDGTIYVCLDDQYLRAVDPNGVIKWVTPLGYVGGFMLSVDKNGLIYAASDDNHLCVVNPAGEEISRFKGNDWLTFPTISADGDLIVSDANNRVWALTDGDCDAMPPALHYIADVEMSWAVNFNDLAQIANQWLSGTEPGIYSDADINRDQYVDLDDIAVLANQWLMGAGL